MRSFRFNDRGSSIIELMLVAALITILLTSATSNLKVLNNPVLQGSQHLMGFFKQARARAMSTTRAYLVYPGSTSTVIAGYANSCAEAEVDTTQDTSLRLDFPNGAALASTSWSVCFSSRGMADENITAAVQDNDGNSRTVEVLLGGAVRVQE